MRLTKDEAIANYRKMWNWIADETLKQERKVEELEYFDAHGIENTPYNHCYCCEYDHNQSDTDCSNCPINWGGEYGGCEDRDESCDGRGFYVLWEDETNYVIAAGIARLIAELPEREDKSSAINNDEKMILKVKYFDKDIDVIKKIDKGDWIDLRAAEKVKMKKGEFKLIPLGVGMILPKGYEAHVVPRSSTYKNFGIIQTNHFGIIDESYCGNDDQWMFPAYALKDTVINKNERICQFRIIKKQPEIEFVTVDTLNTVSRGGIGSTGTK